MSSQGDVMSAGQVPTWTRGDRFRKARELTGLTQREFADRIGVGRTTVVNAETGKAVLRVTAIAWASATGVSLDWLLEGDGDGADFQI